jgi:RND superfamily putative drug exporter
MAARKFNVLPGFGLTMGYTLFYLKREREERARGRTPAEALRIAAATSGRSILVSGITVVAAVGGLFLTGNAISMRPYENQD